MGIKSSLVSGRRSWGHLNRCILDLHAVPYGPDFVDGVLRVLRRTISGDFGLYGVTLPAERATIFGLREPEDIDVRRFTPVFDRYFYDHPLNQPRSDIATGAVLSIADTAGPAWLRSGMANEFCRPNGVTYQLMLRLPSTNDCVEAIGVARPGRAFSVEDRRCFEILKDHLLLAFNKARAFPLPTEEHGDASSPPLKLERISVDVEGRVLGSTEGAQRLLREWFPSASPLPDPVARWLRGCLEASPEIPAAFDRRLVLPSDDGHLELWLTSWLGPDSYDIYLKPDPRTRSRCDGWEHRQSRSSTATHVRERRNQLAHASRRWDLSSRQQQVLDLVIQGLANKEIGAALGCAEVTVEFHVSGLFRRSGAESRLQLASMFWNG